MYMTDNRESAYLFLREKRLCGICRVFFFLFLAAVNGYLFDVPHRQQERRECIKILPGSKSVCKNRLAWRKSGWYDSVTSKSRMRKFYTFSRPERRPLSAEGFLSQISGHFSRRYHILMKIQYKKEEFYGKAGHSCEKLAQR